MLGKLLLKFDELELLRSARLRHALAFPFIAVMIVPLVIFDFFLEIYHRACFPLYRLPLVKRENYIKYDRHKLQYLSVLEKVFCAYCSYANGFAGYAQAIAAKTEAYWCAIKHKKYADFIEPGHHRDFAEYGDEEGYKKLKDKTRNQL